MRSSDRTIAAGSIPEPLSHRRNSWERTPLFPPNILYEDTRQDVAIPLVIGKRRRMLHPLDRRPRRWSANERMGVVEGRESSMRFEVVVVLLVSGIYTSRHNVRSYENERIKRSFAFQSPFS
jgi:hypothetical protein